jgi:hypothetical protein
MGRNDVRNRSERKAVTFTPGEWKRVERRLESVSSVFLMDGLRMRVRC